MKATCILGGKWPQCFLPLATGTWTRVLTTLAYRHIAPLVRCGEAESGANAWVAAEVLSLGQECPNEKVRIQNVAPLCEKGHVSFGGGRQQVVGMKLEFLIM